MKPLPTKIAVLHAVLITLVVVATIMRFGHPFYYNPLDSMWSDPARHFNNALDVKGQDLASILNAPGFELFLEAVLRITGKNATLIATVFGALSAVTPYCYYRWFRELTRDKTISLIGYVLIAFLPSYWRIFAYFMDSVILLPLTATALWLTWRAARKQTWSACALAAVFCGAASCTKSVALPTTVLPWLYVTYQIFKTKGKLPAIKLAAPSVAIILAIYGLGPLKVWTHTGAIVLMPDGLYNQRYFESGAHDIQVTNSYSRLSEGEYVAVCIWGSSSVCYPPFHPFSNWMSARKGRFCMDMDYKHGRDYIAPINLSFQDRLKWTFENIIFFFFQYQWPEDNDWQDPFPRNIPTLVRFAWLPLTTFMLVAVLGYRRKEFMGWYFLALTCLFMFQQSAVMEGRYKKLWEAVAIGAALNVVARSRFYKNSKFACIDEMPGQLVVQKLAESCTQSATKATSDGDSIGERTTPADPPQRTDEASEAET